MELQISVHHVAQVVLLASTQLTFALVATMELISLICILAQLDVLPSIFLTHRPGLASLALRVAAFAQVLLRLNVLLVEM